MNIPRAIVFASLLLLFAPAPHASAEPGKKVTIKSVPIAAFLPSRPNQKTFGKLEFLKGYILSSSNDGFGGFSGLRQLNNSRYFAISDKGKWLDISFENNLASARMGRLRDASGKKLEGKKLADSEGLELDGDEFLISFERNHRAERFAFNKKQHLQATRKKPLFNLNDTGLGSNKGPEGIALAPPTSPLAGYLLAFPEIAFNDAGDQRVFTFKDGVRDELAFKAFGGYSLTDAAFADNGDLFVLERKLSLFSGRAMRIRKFQSDTIAIGAVLRGETIIEVDGTHMIDNMEGLSVSSAKDGNGLNIALISDDNFNHDQQTLLIEFLMPR